MKKLELCYLISNGGDGSVSIDWYESTELAEWYEEWCREQGSEIYMWGEPCGGTITISSESSMEANIMPTTAISLYGGMMVGYDNDPEGAAYILENFLGGEKPVFTVKSCSYEYQKKMHYGMKFLIGDEEVGTKYGLRTEPTQDEMIAKAEELNSIEFGDE